MFVFFGNRRSKQPHANLGKICLEKYWKKWNLRFYKGNGIDWFSQRNKRPPPYLVKFKIVKGRGGGLFGTNYTVVNSFDINCRAMLSWGEWIGKEERDDDGISLQSEMMNILVLFSERRKIPNYLRNSFLSPVSGFNVVIPYEVPFKSLSILYLPLEELFFYLLCARTLMGDSVIWIFGWAVAFHCYT